MNEVLAFDWGTEIVGVLDVKTGLYMAYRGEGEMIEGAKRVLSVEGTIVSFNGNACDLPRLFELLQREQTECALKATHDDMLVITSTIRWAPDPGTGPINGPGLCATYTHYFGESKPSRPCSFTGEYEANNWLDCYMAAELWKKWKRDELAP
ncbi:hypothetical protein P3T23_009353 [Paraburkholderia sp. GAS448]|uniref:hypothetical protein n=1 Tax=Paraburkholderia sp. GAS448 TaxID=3035136 RepID=UPI003D197B0A